MKKIEHIGIAVENMEEANQRFAKLLGVEAYKQERVDSEGVLTSFFRIGDSKIELLAATHDGSPIKKFIDKKGEGIHHIAFEVDDIVEEIDRLKRDGFIILNDIPKEGADNKRIAFIHPKSTGGVLVEICQEKK